MSGKRVSICIPVYNGAATLAETLESIVSQQDPKLEVVLCDDASTDNSYEIAKSYEQRYPGLVKAYRNEKNLGMDGNFLMTARHASAGHVWFSGQDDLFCAGAVRKVLSILERRPDAGLIYLNYSHHNHDFTETINPSVMSSQAVRPAELEGGRDFEFNSAAEYFEHFVSGPSFLPATIVRKDYLTETDLEPYFGTHYVQLAAIYLNMSRAPLVVVSEPLVRGRVPKDGWQSKPHSHFSVLLGNVAMETMVARDPRSPLPAKFVRERRNKFLREYLYFVLYVRKKGMRPTAAQFKSLRNAFGSGPLYWLGLYPAMRMPLPVLQLTYKAYLGCLKLNKLLDRGR